MPPHGQCPFPFVWTTNRPGPRGPEHVHVARPKHNNSSVGANQVTTSFLCSLIRRRSPELATPCACADAPEKIFFKKKTPFPSLRSDYCQRNPRCSSMQGRAGQVRLLPEWQAPSRVADWLTSAGRSVLLTREIRRIAWTWPHAQSIGDNKGDQPEGLPIN